MALALPWMESLPLFGAADTVNPSKPPLRLATIYWSNGIKPAHWWAQGEGAAMEFGQSAAPLTAYAKDIVFIKGLFNERALGNPSPHQGRNANLLSGARVSSDPSDIRVGTSMDQILSKEIGSRTAVPSVALGIEPNELRLEDGLSMIYASNISPVAGIGQSSHNLGFAVRLTVSTNPSGGLTPLWVLKDGAPAWPPPPSIDPAVGLGTNPPYYGGNQANRPDSELNYSFNIQRQITRSSVFEVGYLSTLASDITSKFLAINQVSYRSLPASLCPFTTAGRTALGSVVGSAAAIAAGVTGPPWTCPANCTPFATLYGSSATVTQALRPYPQYTTINTLDGGGDRIGHSTYHSVMFKFDKRMASGLTVQASYKISKLLTDSDSTTSAPGDMYNLRLLKSIAAFDQTNQVKLSWV